MSLYEESNQFRAELEQQVKNVDIREITQLPNFKNWFNSKKAHSKCYDYDLPKLFYRTLNSIDNLDNIVNGNEQSRFVGEYFTDDLDTALTYVEHLENSKILIGFLNIQNPAIIDCNGAGWNEIRQNATVTEQLAYFEYLGFNEKPDNFEENKAYPIDLRNDEKDDGISFFLQIKTINKDTTPSFIKITAPQYYQNDKSFRKTKFINLDMLGYGTPSLFNDIGTTNFWATNLAHRHRFDSVIFENLNDDGGRGVALFEKSVKKRKMQGTVVCAFDRENSYFKHANNHGDFNPDDRRIFYSLFDIEQDFKQEKTEKDKTMEKQTMQQTQATQQTAAQGGFSSPKNSENTANYDVRGLPEFSGSVAAYFNNSERQELVLAFKQTLERSFDLRHQHFIGIHPKQQVQFDRIAAFSPLELSAILDCKPEFANNMREYIAVVEDFERNHQQKLEDFKKA
ncbi:MAG: hypothetical protein IJ780_05580, partial [Neisseriaceae bacterium]|nr:hypothetical protein [Neisseriaceae bacterium]